MCAHTRVCLHEQFVVCTPRGVPVHIKVCTYTFSCAHTHFCVCMHMPFCEHAQVYVQMYTLVCSVRGHVHVCACAHVCVGAYGCTRNVFVCAHTHVACMWTHMCLRTHTCVHADSAFATCACADKVCLYLPTNMLPPCGHVCVCTHTYVCPRMHARKHMCDACGICELLTKIVSHFFLNHFS